MRKSKDERVQKFLDKLKKLDIGKYKTLQAMRGIVFKQYPNVGERIMYGGIMFSLEKDFGGLFVSENHISFEFSNGYKMKEPTKFLEGVGKFRRHLKIKSFEDISDKEVAFFVKQAV